MLLDPRHKLETFSVSTWGRDIKEKSYEKFEECAPKESGASEIVPVIENANTSNQDDSIDFNCFFGTYPPEDKANTSDLCKKDITKYLGEKRVSKNEHILMW